MAGTVSGSPISQTYKNLLFTDVNGSTFGFPVNLDTPERLSASRIQDGLGNISPLRVARTEVSVVAVPLRSESVARLNEVVDMSTIAQNYSLVWS